VDLTHIARVAYPDRRNRYKFRFEGGESSANGNVSLEIEVQTAFHSTREKAIMFFTNGYLQVYKIVGSSSKKNRQKVPLNRHRRSLATTIPLLVPSVNSRILPKAHACSF
jgi:hypothetical protein